MARSPQLQIGGLFVINGTSLFAPDGYQEEPIPVVGYTLGGEPVRQGYATLTFTWSFMKQEHMSALMDIYNPKSPEVRVSFIDKTLGPDQLMAFDAMMHEPVVGARQIVYYNNISVRFTHLRQAMAWVKPGAPVMTYKHNRTSSNQVRMLHPNQAVEILDRPSEGWVMINHPVEGECYLPDKALSYDVRSTRAAVPAWLYQYPVHYLSSTTSVRDTPSGTTTATLYAFTQVEVIGSDGTWTQILHAGIPGYYGWVPTANLTTGKPTTVYQDLYYTATTAWTTGNVTVYSGAGTGSDIGDLKAKTQVEILDQATNWIRVRHFMIVDGKGWIARSHLQFTPPNQLYDDDNYQDRWIDPRQTPGTHAAVYRRMDQSSKQTGTLPDGQKVTLLARYSNNWAKIRQGGIDDDNHVGYIRESLLTDENPN